MHKFGKARARATQSQSLINVVEELGGQIFPFLFPGWTTLRHSTWLLIFIYLFGCIRSQLRHSQWSLQVWLMGSEVAGCRFQSRWAQQLTVACGTLVPQQEIKPSSSSLQAGFLTTGSPQRPIRGSSDVCRNGEAQMSITMTALIMCSQTGFFFLLFCS